MPKTQLLEITPIQHTGDDYNLNNYPGPGAYLTPMNLVFVANGATYTVPRTHIPHLEPKPDPLPPPPPAPLGVSEATLLKAIAIVAAPTKIGDLTF